MGILIAPTVKIPP